MNFKKLYKWSGLDNGKKFLFFFFFFAKKDIYKNSKRDNKPRQETTGQPTSVGQKDWGQTHWQPYLHCYLLCHTTSNQFHLPSIITKGSSETMNKVKCLYHFYFWELYNPLYCFSQEVLNATVKCYLLIYWFWVMRFRLQSIISNSVPIQMHKQIFFYVPSMFTFLVLFYFSGHWQASYFFGHWGCCVCLHASKAFGHVGVYGNIHKGDAIEEIEQW